MWGLTVRDLRTSRVVGRISEHSRSLGDGNREIEFDGRRLIVPDRICAEIERADPFVYLDARNRLGLGLARKSRECIVSACTCLLAAAILWFGKERGSRMTHSNLDASEN